MEKGELDNSRVFSDCSEIPTLDLSDSMGFSSAKSIEKEKSLHEFLGGGIAADVMLWRRRDISISILLAALASLFVFEVWRYTLLSLLSNVFLLLISILFLWAKAASILNRPPPPIPELRISEETINEAAKFLHSRLNRVLSVFERLALGKDTELFYATVVFLCLVSIFGSFTTLSTFCYSAAIVILLTVPPLYEKYEECIEKYLTEAYMEVLMYERIYERFCFMCYIKFNKWMREILEES